MDGLTKAAIAGAGALLAKLTGNALTEISQLLGQEVAWWRFQNAVNTALKADALIKSKGLRPEQLSAELRNIVPLIEGASYEDEPTLQNMWASLITTAALEEFNRLPQPKFSEVLRQLSPLDAQILRHLYKYHVKTKEFYYGQKVGIETGLSISNDIIDPFLVNLDRLSLIRVQIQYDESAYKVYDVILTTFFVEFMKRCTYFEDASTLS